MPLSHLLFGVDANDEQGFTRIRSYAALIMATSRV